MNLSPEEMQALIDKEAIRECLTRLARGLDRGDVELARSCYHADAKDDHGLFIGSGEGIIEWANRSAQTWRSCNHYLSNMLIDLDGDQAHVETYVTFVAVPKDSFEATFGGGRYFDRLERRAGRWAIVDRISVTEWWNSAETLGQVHPAMVPTARDRTDPSYTRPLHVEREPREVGFALEDD